jgi:cytoskeletal protein RodZ
MSSIEAWLIIILVLGVIASNIAVLKYSAKFKMPQFGKPEEKPTSESDSESHSEKTDAEASNQDEATENSAEPKALDADKLKTPSPEHR